MKQIAVSAPDPSGRALLGTLSEHYPQHPWMALLRAVEIAVARKMLSGCQDPVLDLGCGDGSIAALTFSRTVLAGIDHDTRALDSARRAGTYQMAARADARALPFPDGSFATVYSNGALEHMDDVGIVLTEVRRVLQPGGRFLALVPGAAFLKPVGWLPRLLGRGAWLAFNRLHNHVNLYAPPEWRGRLGAAGLDLLEARAYGGPAFAEYVCNRDFWSKLRWPLPLRLRHEANRMAAGATARALGKLFALLQREQEEAGRGLWLALLAERKVGGHP